MFEFIILDSERSRVNRAVRRINALCSEVENCEFLLVEEALVVEGN